MTMLEVKEPRKRVGGRLSVSKKSWKRLKEKIKLITKILDQSPRGQCPGDTEGREPRSGWVATDPFCGTDRKIQLVDVGLGELFQACYRIREIQISRQLGSMPLAVLYLEGLDSRSIPQGRCPVDIEGRDPLADGQKRRYRAFRQLGLSHGKARQFCYSRLGGWRIACSPIMEERTAVLCNKTKCPVDI